jgi:hypothetical protein
MKLVSLWEIVSAFITRTKKNHGKLGTVVGHTAAFVCLVFDPLADDAEVERKRNDKVRGL